MRLRSWSLAPGRDANSGQPLEIVSPDEFRRRCGVHVYAFVDGARSSASIESAPAAGWGALIGSNGCATELFGFEPQASSVHAELWAAIHAIEFIPPARRRIRIHTDCKDIVVIGSDRLDVWIANDWRRVRPGRGSTAIPLLDRTLWRRLMAARDAHDHVVSWQWVRGHRGDRRNERAHELAQKGLSSFSRDMPMAVGSAEPEKTKPELGGDRLSGEAFDLPTAVRTASHTEGASEIDR